MVSGNSDRDHPDDQGPDRAHHRHRSALGAVEPDPLKLPFDVREAIDRIGQDVLSAGTVRDALRDLMRRGIDGRGASGPAAHREPCRPTARPDRSDQWPRVRRREASGGPVHRAKRRSGTYDGPGPVPKVIAITAAGKP